MARNQQSLYQIGPVYGLGNAIAGEKPDFTFNHTWGLSAGLNSERVLLNFSFIPQNNYSDSSESGKFGFFGDQNKSALLFKSIRLGLDLDVRLKSQGAFRPTIGAGLGYLVWQIKDPVADTIINVTDGNDNPVDFNAAEMFLSGSLGLEYFPTRKMSLHLKTSYDILTGLGADFGDATNDRRPRAMMRITLGLSYLFGREGRKEVLSPAWPSEKAWNEQKEDAKPSSVERDSDGDGIIDRYDKCANTPRGAYIDNDGCPKDLDNDGVLDGLDDCPRTPHSARGYIDIHGCPIDSDYDGVADYKDNCKNGPVGALVDEFGCPTDRDGDSVYDGLDDCPDTREGIGVDERGCIDISFLSKPYIVNVDYQPGSFEVDERTKKRIMPLIRKLKILSHVKIRINGYTDNIGPAEANQTVSLRRANRMRDWLETQGIDRGRMTPRGRGETNFISSNQTAAGRAKNRRIELIFDK